MDANPARVDPRNAELGPASEAGQRDEHQERTKIMSPGNLMKRLSEETEKKTRGEGADTSFLHRGKPSWTGVPGYDPLEVSVSKTDEIFNQLIRPLGRIARIAAIALQALVLHRIERAELIARGEVDKRHEEESKKWPYRLGTMSDEEFKARIQAHRAALRIETADRQQKEVQDEIDAWLQVNGQYGTPVKQQEKKIAATKQLVAAKEEYAAVYTRIKEILEANNERVRTQEVGRNASTNRATDRNGCENNNNGHSNLSLHMIEPRGCNAAENRNVLRSSQAISLPSPIGLVKRHEASTRCAPTRRDMAEELTSRKEPRKLQ